MTDEQYIDELFAREVVGMDTPGFRDFVLDLMGMIGERPRAGDVCSMHLAYRAGMEQSQAPNWTPTGPRSRGYWLSLPPKQRTNQQSAIPWSAIQAAASSEYIMMGLLESG